MNVPTLPIKFSLKQVLSLSRQLPIELKLQLIREWLSELEKSQESTPIPSLNLEEFDKPFDLDKAKLTKKQLAPLQNLWADELPAEELIKIR